jgi:FdhD protein
MRGQRFMCLSGKERLIWDADPNAVKDEPRKSGRKGGKT